jgi:hypothetical protein
VFALVISNANFTVNQAIVTSGQIPLEKPHA